MLVGVDAAGQQVEPEERSRRLRQRQLRLRALQRRQLR